ncbi:MAG TPA: S41 family peptidase [Bacteroidales bacterium]|nr:S41 family peptidase [Bacteroidales bacterium]HRZ48587.1 S41 family peptidase [Bacteroidales bacterium]
MPIRALIAALFLLSISFMTQVHAQQYPMELSLTDKLYGLSRAWQEVESQSVSIYRKPGPDTDSLFRAYLPMVLNSANDYEYYRLLQRFLASFNDPFTRVELPKRLTDSIITLPLVFREARGRYFLANADSRLAARIPVGSEIHRVNGFDIRTWLENEVVPYIASGTPQLRNALALEALPAGWINTQLLLSFTTPDGRSANEVLERIPYKKIQWVFPRNTEPDGAPVMLEWQEGDIALVTLYRLDDATLTSFPDQRQLIKAKAILLDLRNCQPGNNLIAAARLALRFSNQSQVTLPGFGTRNQAVIFTGADQIQGYGSPSGGPLFSIMQPDSLENDTTGIRYGVPLFVLTGATTASNAEHLIVMLLQLSDNVRLIGETTAGSTGASVSSILPGGGRLYVGQRFDFYPGNDTWFEQGIKPDIQVSADIKSLLNGEDLVLKKAHEAVKKAQ